MSMLSDQQIHVLNVLNDLGYSMGSHGMRQAVANAGKLTIRFQHDLIDLCQRGLIEVDLRGLTITRAGIKALAA